MEKLGVSLTRGPMRVKVERKSDATAVAGETTTPLSLVTNVLSAAR
jgi:hypothetical protein